MEFWYSLLFALLATAFLLPREADAQRSRRPIKQRFHAGLLFGANLSQVDGDQYNGFDKGNLQFGVTATAVLTRQAEIGIELLYIGKGSMTETGRTGVIGEKNRNMDLNYMEVPVYFSYKMKEEAPFSFVEAGVSYGRMISSEVTEPSVPGDGLRFQALEESFNRNELSLLFSYGYQVSKPLGFKFRFGIALSEYYHNPTPQEERTLASFFTGGEDKRVDFLRNYYMSLSGFYRF